MKLGEKILQKLKIINQSDQHLIQMEQRVKEDVV